MTLAAFHPCFATFSRHFLITAGFALSAHWATPDAQARDWDCAKKHTIDPLQPTNIGQLKDVLREYRYCGGYDKEFASVISKAKDELQKQASQTQNPALVLDIDETSLSNWLEIELDDFAFIPGGTCTLETGAACGDTAWELSARAEALAPTLDLFNTAKSLNVTIFFITGRSDRPDLRAATIQNLKQATYDGWKELFMRPISSPGANVTEYKTRMRAHIEDDLQYHIIVNVGDQQSDLSGAHTGQAFKVPNPFYFIP
ncbi:HAD family acid phosphatase [Bradyrhizobium sp. B097]|uniref:HAD family acid phosphatase n=1 Tax=Bradyrhizobium sp. B097 TaxID=3140244 RepID=UPI0031830CBA